VQEGAKLTAQPPAAECFEAALNADAWHNCKLILDKMINYFVLQRAPDESSMQPRVPRHLPATPVRFDAVLCSTVRDAVDAASAAPLDSVAMVKWLLLPYLNRKEWRQPFLGDGESSEGQICWVCAVQVRGYPVHFVYRSTKTPDDSDKRTRRHSTPGASPQTLLRTAPFLSFEQQPLLPSCIRHALWSAGSYACILPECTGVP
jgi:hypothetical protein